MDTEYDLDPQEQRRRRSAWILQDFSEEAYDQAFSALDTARDQGDWSGSLGAQKDAAKRIASAAMLALYAECEPMPARDIMRFYVEMDAP